MLMKSLFTEKFLNTSALCFDENLIVFVFKLSKHIYFKDNLTPNSHKYSVTNTGGQTLTS